MKAQIGTGRWLRSNFQSSDLSRVHRARGIRRSEEMPAERLGRGPVGSGCRLCVQPERQARIRVAEPHTRGLEIDALCNESRRIRTPKIVEGDALETGLAHRRQPYASSPSVVAQW